MKPNAKNEGLDPPPVRGSLLGVMGLLACSSPEPLFPPQPVVAGATSVVWAATDASGAAVRILREPGAPLGRTIALADGADLELHFFGCDGPALGIVEERVPSCLPATGPRFRWRPGEPAFEPLGDRPSLVAECGSKRCERVVPRAVELQEAESSDPQEATSTAVLLESSSAEPAVLLSSFDSVGATRLLRFERGADPAPIASIPEIGHSSGLWAGDGEIWSVSHGGFRRGVFEGSTIRWSESLAASTATIGIGSLRIAFDVLSTDPYELLVVASNGLVARWSKTSVEIVQPGRPLQGPRVHGGRCDVAQLHLEDGRQDGFLLIGPALPLLDEEESWRARALVQYRDGSLLPEIPFAEAASVNFHPELGSVAMDEESGIYRFVDGAPRLLFSVPGGSAERIRSFQDRWVMVRNNGELVFVGRQNEPCPNPAPSLANTIDVLSNGAWLVEIGQRRQVRWYQAAPECSLE